MRIWACKKEIVLNVKTKDALYKDRRRVGAMLRKEVALVREILFRGKTDNGEWVEGFYGQFHNRPTLNEPNKHQIFVLFTKKEEKQNKGHFLSAIGGIWHTCDPETVGQYTGLTDKNGKKIFEGDILRTGTRMGYMLFEEGCFRFRWKNFDKYRPDFFKTCIITEYGSFRELEVIGNIHDNPELLKGGAE